MDIDDLSYNFRVYDDVVSYYFRVEKMLMLMLMCPLTIKGGEDVDVDVNVSSNNYKGWRRC